jgi:hypothetical protein
MAVQTPLFLQKTGADADVSYSATNYRLSLVKALIPVTGVVDPYGSNGLKVSQRGAGANFSVDIASGYAFIPGGDVANQGTYVVFNDATVNVATPTAPGSGTRVHRLVLQIRDKLNNGAYTTYDGILSLLQDTGSGTPATPASAISLATISISVGQANVGNANITDTRAWARPIMSQTGTLTGSGWTSPDATRPASWRLTADGFVHLYGWMQPSSGFTATSGVLNIFAGGLPAQAIPSGNRDMIGACSVTGFTRLLVQSNGNLYMIMPTTQAFITSDWISLDGASYKVGA